MVRGGARSGPWRASPRAPMHVTVRCGGCRRVTEHELTERRRRAWLTARKRFDVLQGAALRCLACKRVRLLQARTGVARG